MNKESTNRLLCTLLAVAGMLLIVWWALLGLSQTAGDSGGSLAQLALTPAWLPVNLVGLLASLLLVLGLIGVLSGAPGALGTFGLVGTVLGIAGATLFTALQFEETFVWPLLARHAAELLEVRGPMFTDPAFFAGYVVMGALFAAGFVMLAGQSLRRRLFPVVPSVFLLVGALLFAGGILIPLMIRTVGVALLGASLVWIGFGLRKRPVGSRGKAHATG